ncbi:MAG: hypothetical protein HC901_04585 [Bdellovibrionaceae bacterium]|nr:hypothetical protein [Pseudobdellovibrionaceae bacterium]
MLLEFDILLVEARDVLGILRGGIGERDGKVDLGLFQVGLNVFPVGGVGPGFQIFLVMMNGADRVPEFSL